MENLLTDVYFIDMKLHKPSQHFYKLRYSIPMNPWNILLANIFYSDELSINIEPFGRGKFLIDKNNRNDELEKSCWWKNAEKYT